MRSDRVSMNRVAVTAMIAVCLCLASTGAIAQREIVLHNFNAPVTPFNGPAAGLVFDAAGNLYGTTQSAGLYRGGTVFELIAKAGGGWTAKTLHNFNPSTTDGSQPAAPLIFDAAGNLYGTTGFGGANGYGTAFELKPNPSGGWTEKVLYSFSRNEGTPDSGLIFDRAGNLYGTTAGYNGPGYGIVFVLTPQSNGAWTENTLHAFNYDGKDGIGPSGGLIFDAAGNLYGTTDGGGSYDCGFGCGTVFELTPGADGIWAEIILHRFHKNGTDGIFPGAGLSFDAAGNLYGTTIEGGTGPCTSNGNPGCGVVFELSPVAGVWKGKILHDFNGTDGYQPTGLTRDAAGNLYGTTEQGGTGTCTSLGLTGCGTVFKLALKAGGIWTEKVLHNFAEGTDGIEPLGGVILDSSGNLYGTTYHGGAYGGTYDYNGGTVFRITP